MMALPQLVGEEAARRHAEGVHIERTTAEARAAIRPVGGSRRLLKSAG